MVSVVHPLLKKDVERIVSNLKNLHLEDAEANEFIEQISDLCSG
ncbi:MAG: hypothetical protein ABH829_00285 [archaeon]